MDGPSQPDLTDEAFSADPRRYSGDPAASGWWSRPAGGREVLQVALPLVVSAMSWTVMTFVDRMFLQWESGAAMTAAFSGGTVWFAAICLPMGVCAYANTFVSQYFGNRQPRKIGPAVWQGVWAALACSPAMLLVIPLAPLIFHAAGHDAAIQQLEVQYLQILLLGAPAMLIGQALSAFYSGQGRTSVVMTVDAAFAVVNLLLDYAWIFGALGFPAMGIAGAGWATTTALWLKAFAYLWLVLRRKNRVEFGVWSGLRFDRDLFGRLIYFGAPSGFQLLLDVLGFTIFILLVGRLGAIQAEATSIAFSVSTLAFMPIWGIGLAVGILVGQRLGENRPDLAARSTWTALTVGLAYMALISLLYWFTPDLFLFGFFAGSEPAGRHAAVRSLAAMLLRFVAAYNLLDAALMVFVSAVKGAGDTMFLLKVSVVMAVMLAGLTWIGVEHLEVGVVGCWALITVWVWLMGAIFCWRFLQGKWRAMRVIEMPTGALATIASSGAEAAAPQQPGGVLADAETG